ncbi:hypothetical protein [Halothiobacillus sp.]|uniref:hypothetical protein n=1 Tax=Halothiobacillus sp. TaxID=1891311 RepID=UPI002615E157|nr:hypothetical protein [Halothiobacillus sp.]MDD4965757.1 hypothetical protein [Halothiobacillus sp.]
MDVDRLLKMESAKIESAYASTEVSLGDLDESPQIVWWHGALLKSTNEDHQPKIWVVLREIALDTGRFGEVAARKIPVTSLGHLLVGAVRHRKKKIGVAVYDYLQCEVSFDADKWEIVPLESLPFRGMFKADATVFDKHIKSSNLVKLSTPDGISILIPCQTFFSRFYGKSEELRRILLTYPRELIDARLYVKAPPEVLNAPGKRVVPIHPRLSNGDAVFLAHLDDPEDDYARQITKTAYNTYQTDWRNGNPAFLYAGPWYQGPVQLKTTGVWVSSHTFLVLNIHGATDPDGPEILIAKSKNLNEGSGSKPPPKDNGPRRRFKPDTERDAVELEGDRAPGRDAGTIQLHNPDWEVLGTPRKKRSISFTGSTRSSGPRRGRIDNTTNATSSASAGDPYGSGSGINQAQICTMETVESKGVLRDVWDAFIHLCETQTPIDGVRVLNVECLDFDGNFVSDTDPILITFPQASDKLSLDEQAMARKWLRMGKGNTQRRGAMLMKVTTTSGYFFLFENQRRVKKPKDADENTDPNRPLSKRDEESFRALVFTLDSDDDLGFAIYNLLNRLPPRKGVFNPPLWSNIGIYSPVDHNNWGKEETLPGRLFAMKVVRDMLKGSRLARIPA